MPWGSYGQMIKIIKPKRLMIFLCEQKGYKWN